MTNILVCDDTLDDLNAISAIIEKYYSNADNIKASPYSLSRFSDPKTALAYIEDGKKPDIAILDIMMPGMNGMELASQMREIGFGGYLIFLTTFNDFAAQSYAVKAFSYLLKPAKKENVFELLETIEDSRRANDRNGFSLIRKNGAQMILFSELMYVEVISHQLFFHLIQGEQISIYATLKDYSELLLREPQMYKAHRSFIVNLDCVRACENNHLIMRDGVRISVPKDFETVKVKWLERMFGKRD